MLKELGADLLYCPFTDPTYYEPGIPAVSTIYDLQYKTYPQFFSAADVHHRDLAFKRAAEKATLLAAISDYSRGSAIEHGLIPEDRIETIHIRLAHRVKVIPAASLLDQWGLSPQGYVIYPANFWMHKNHEVLLTAFLLAQQQGLPKEIQLVLTGAPGARRDWLIKATERMGLGDSVIFPGYVATHELGALIANSLGMVFPSLYEGFGMPIIEAMAMGVPVACSDLTSLPEVAGDAAIPFDPRIPASIATAIHQLYADQPVRDQRVSKGLERAKIFADHERMAREYMSLFERAVALHQPRNQIVGRFEDGWLGANLWIQTEVGDSSRVLELDFSTECWMPEKTAKMFLLIDGEGVQRFRMKRGTRRTISVPLDENPHLLEWRFLPYYVPADFELGEDQRQLSMILTGCRIKGSGGMEVDLLAGSAA
jgi:glycosyltransferase involved in cell wall biosynthesis